jgi:flagellar basal-body rod modification protein FlgD
MTINTIGNTTTATAPTNPSANISIQDFLRILTTQLNNQDPLKPMDNTQFVAQLAQFTSLQETQQTNEKLDTLLNIQSATQSVGLIGRTVDVGGSGGGTQTGQVSGLDFSSGQALLNVTVSGGQALTGVSLSNVTNIR